jgi:hypothetical protein
MSNFLGKMIKKTATGFVVSSATALAVSSISKALHLDDSKVGKILAVGIPMMTFLAADDPKVSDLLFKESKKKDRKKDKSKKEAEADYFHLFGKDKAQKMNKAIAEETGTTEDEVNGVMSLFTPFFVDAVAEEDPEDAGALGKLFKSESEDAKKHSPSLAKMAMKAVF